MAKHLFHYSTQLYDHVQQCFKNLFETKLQFLSFSKKCPKSNLDTTFRDKKTADSPTYSRQNFHVTLQIGETNVFGWKSERNWNLVSFPKSIVYLKMFFARFLRARPLIVAHASTVKTLFSSFARFFKLLDHKILRFPSFFHSEIGQCRQLGEKVYLLIN